MIRLLGIFALLLSFALPAFSQAQRMTLDDQDRFNSYYSRWSEDRQTNNRDDMLSMEQRMQDLMTKYAIPPDTPYAEVAAAQGSPRPYDRDDRYRYEAGSWRGRLSPDDQNHFNKEYQKWQESRAKHDQDDVDKHARKMEEIMTRYNIPPDTPFDTIATQNGYGHYSYRQFVGRMSPDDQKEFDKAYEHWMKDRQKNDRDDLAKDEGKMQSIMGRYGIPRDVPYDLLASSARGY